MHAHARATACAPSPDLRLGMVPGPISYPTQRVCTHHTARPRRATPRPCFCRKHWEARVSPAPSLMGAHFLCWRSPLAPPRPRRPRARAAGCSAAPGARARPARRPTGYTLHRPLTPPLPHTAGQRASSRAPPAIRL
ncbi:MAG: hypothetical protein J3K34DRAFT_376487 [Monoraphidium minutum]|nr:MAG: hypothetical protein J3K34DRAFT_376487 [Monoraphidium minutum]